MDISVETRSIIKIQPQATFITARTGQVPGLYRDNTGDIWLVDMRGNIVGHFNTGNFFPYDSGRYDLYKPQLIDTSIEVVLRNV